MYRAFFNIGHPYPGALKDLVQKVWHDRKKIMSGALHIECSSISNFVTFRSVCVEKNLIENNMKNL